jgi:hypothetical protein
MCSWGEASFADEQRSEPAIVTLGVFVVGAVVAYVAVEDADRQPAAAG